MMTQQPKRPEWQREDGSVSFDDLDQLMDEHQAEHQAKARQLDAEEQAVANEFAGQTRSKGSIGQYPCEKCRGTGTVTFGYTHLRTGKCHACNGRGWFRQSPSQRQAARDKAAQKRRAAADANLASARAFLESRPDVAAWFKRQEQGRYANEFAESLRDALNKYGRLTPNQLAAVERSIARDAEFDAKRAAEAAKPADPNALDLSALPSGYYAIPEGETRLKVRVSRPGKDSRWHGFTFVDDGAAYGQRQNYGRQKPGGRYEGKIVEQLRAIMADPAEASKAYGKLVGRCGVCGRLLEDEQSIAAGIGPVCAGRMGW